MKRGPSWGEVSGGLSSSYNRPVRGAGQQAGRRTRPSRKAVRLLNSFWIPAGSRSRKPLGTNRWGGRGNRHEREREGASAREVGGRVRQAHFRGSKWRLRSPRPRFPLMAGEAGASPDSPRTDHDDSDLRRRRDTAPLCSAPGFVLMLRMCCAGPNRPLRAGQVFLLI